MLSCCRGEPSIKVAALNLMAAAVEGLGNNDRNVLTVHAEALKTADKYAKDKYSDNTLRQGHSARMDIELPNSCPARLQQQQHSCHTPPICACTCTDNSGLHLWPNQ